MVKLTVLPSALLEALGVTAPPRSALAVISKVLPPLCP